MARTSNSYNCGCGYHTTSLEAAEGHSDKTGHTITVLGTIRPSVIIPEAAKPRQRKETPGLRKYDDETREEPVSSFAEEMRKRIKNGGN